MSANNIGINVMTNSTTPTEAKGVKNAVPEGNAGEQSQKTMGMQTKTLNKETLANELEEANHRLRMNNSHCEFRFVEEANRIAIKVIDNDTDEVIKEIPSEEALKTIQSLREMTGLLMDQQS